MITPPPLKIGDKVGILSTARKISREELQPAVSLLEKWGFQVVFGEHLFKEHHQFAGTDEERRSDLQAFINDDDIKAILCARGGYGSVRIIDNVDFSPLRKKPKWIGGYSDVTVLHNKLSQMGIESLHCTMPINFRDNTPRALESLRKALFDEKISYTVEGHSFNKKGEASAEITGGNLSMIYSQAGSNTKLETEGKVLFIEDLDEYLYHIDRMMYNLKRNGYLENLAGLIVGGMSDMNDNQIPFGQSAEEIIQEHIHGYSYPVCFGFPAGHLNDNRSLIFGRKATFKVENNVKLDFDGGTF